MARRAEDRERRHIRAEEREQKNELTQRAIGQKIVFRRMLAHFAAESEDSDVNDDRQVSEDEKRGNHASRPSVREGAPGRRGAGEPKSPSPALPPSHSPTLSSRRDGQAYLTKAHINAEITSV